METDYRCRAQLPAWVLEAAGTDYAGYDLAVLARRLDKYLALTGPGELDALRSGVTDLQVILSSSETGFFNVPEFWQTLRSRVIPRLRTYPSVRIWVPGCGTGLTAYALAIVLEEEGLLDRTQVFATELLDGPLAHARAGLFPTHEIERSEGDFCQTGGSGTLMARFSPNGQGTCSIMDRFKARIYFAQYNVVTDASFNEFQLIVCRGLLPSLEEPLRRRAQRLFRDSLCRTGVLALGGGESLSIRNWAGFCAVADAPDLLRKGVLPRC